MPPKRSSRVVTQPVVQKIVTTREQFRCTLHPMFEVFSSISNNLNSEHVRYIDKTPFRHLFHAIIDKDILIEKRTNHDLDSLISTHVDKQGFFLGGEYFFPSAHEIQLLLGLEDGCRAIGSLRQYSQLECRLKDAFFFGSGSIRMKEVKDLICSESRQSDPRSVSNTVKLLCLLLVGTLFFSTTGQTIAFSLAYLVDKFSRMRSYDWSSAILSFLVEGFAREWSDPRQVRGCTFILPYWFCERCVTVPSGYLRDLFLESSGNELTTRAIPRLRKWNLKEFAVYLTPSLLQNMSSDEFSPVALTCTLNEIHYLRSSERLFQIRDGVASPLAAPSGDDSDVLSDGEEAGSVPDSAESDGVNERECDVESDSEFGPHADTQASTCSSQPLYSASSPRPQASDEFFVTADGNSPEGRCAASSLDIEKQTDGSDTDCTPSNYYVQAIVPPSILSAPALPVLSVSPGRSLDMPSFSLGLTQSPPDPVAEMTDTVSEHTNLEAGPLSTRLPDVENNILACQPDQGKGMLVEVTLESLRLENTELLENLAASQLRNDELRSALAKATLFEQSLVHMTTKSSAFESEILRLQGALEDSKKDADARIALLESQLAEAIKYEASLKLMTERSATFQSDAATFRVVADTYMSQCTELKKENEGLHDKLTLLNDDYSVLQASYEELKVLNAKTAADLISRTDTLKHKEESLSIISMDHHSLLQRFTSLQYEVERLKTSVCSKDGLINDLKAEVNELKDNLAVARKTVADQNTEIQLLKHRNEGLSVSLENLIGDPVEPVDDDSLTVVDSTPKGQQNLSSLVQRQPEYPIELDVKQHPRERKRNRLSPYDYSWHKRHKNVIIDNDSDQPSVQVHVGDHEYLLADDNECFISTGNPVDESGKLIIDPDRLLYPCGQYIIPDVFADIVRINNEHGPTGKVWTNNAGDQRFVDVACIMYILNDLHVDESIFEGVIDLMRRSQLLKDTCTVMSITFNYVIQECNRSGSYQHESFLDLVLATHRQQRVLLPFCCSGLEGRPYHWDLLSYKKSAKTWYLYHSAPVPKGSLDPFKREVELLLVKIWEGLQTPGSGWSSGCGNLCTKVTKAHCIPLHNNESNCILYVCFYVYMLCQDQKIPKVLEDDQVQEWKGIIVNSLVRNEFLNVPFV